MDNRGELETIASEKDGIEEKLWMDISIFLVRLAKFNR